ncbi:MAG: leucine-rich repeat domain-containing protein [Holosporales bacterium]|nr:leucine-rich repeat domain-containing protein [Holosporales bacterium]
MARQKIASMVFACAAGVLNVLPAADAMFLWPPSDDLFPREVAAYKGALVTPLPQQKSGVLSLLEPRTITLLGFGLHSIIIPRRVDTLWKHYLADCRQLSFVAFETDSQLRIIGEHALEKCTIRSIAIPRSVEVLEDWCFANCAFLSCVIFESCSQLRIIGEHALEKCAIRSIAIPKSVEVFEDWCFAHCASLSRVTFESCSRLTKIGTCAFLDSVLLRGIALPASVVKLKKCCFFGCKSLACVTFDRGSQLRTIGREAFAHAPLGCIHLPEHSDMECGVYVFRDSGIMEIYFGNVRAGSFCGLYAGTDILQFLEVPASISTIQDSCFGWCGSLTSVTFEPHSRLIRIGKSAFSWSSLRSICIPRSVEEIGEGCFSHCRFLTSATFEADSRLRIVEDMAFAAVTLDCILLPSEVALGRMVFTEAHIGTIGLGDEQASFFSGAYAGTSDLQWLIVPPEIVTIRASCFENSRSLIGVSFEDNSQLERIEENAFCGSGVQSIFIPASLKELRSRCFARCWSLTSVVFEGGSCLQVIDESAFEGCVRAQIIFSNGISCFATQFVGYPRMLQEN